VPPSDLGDDCADRWVVSATTQTVEYVPQRAAPPGKNPADRVMWDDLQQGLGEVQFEDKGT
jgi:hypothetical protein